MLKDIRYALRTLRQNPGFAFTAIISIALAIGANSAIFAMADGILLRPLAVPNPSQIVSLRARTPSGNFGAISYADFADIRDRNRSFENLVAYDIAPAGFAKDVATQPQLKVGLLVSGNFFSALNVEPQFGRAFLPEEDKVPARDAVVVISHDLWKSEFGADPSVIGRKVRLNGLEFVVIGITPESFTGIEHMLRPAFYVPAMMGPKLSSANEHLLTDRAQRSFYLKARLKPGVSIQAAQADVAAIATSLEESYPATNRAFGAAVFTELQERVDFDGPYDAQLLTMLFSLVIVVLSIACANVANLMLSRGRARAREIAVRLAVGASRRRLIRHLLAESLLIALAGGALGLIIAQYAVDVFSTIQIPSDLPLQFTFQLDHRVTIFTLLVSLASAILFGLVPALQSTKTDLVSTLKAGESDEAHKRLFGRRALVVVQIAGSLVLLVAAAEIYRSIEASLTGNHGFRIDHRLTMRFAPAAAGYTPAQAERFYKTLLESARNLAGVKSAALSADLPMTSNFRTEVVFPEGYQFPQGQEGNRVLTDYVTDHYFETFAIPILAGRGFLETDRADSVRVAVVNEAFARHYLAGNPIGKRIRVGRNGPWIEVVGMTITGKYFTVFEGVDEFLYLPYAQHPQTRMTLIAETHADPAAMAGPLREMVHSIDANVPVFAVRTMEDLFDQRSVKIANLFIGIVGSLGVMGLVLALVGLYAVVSYQVSRKTREIGIRVALGAERRQVVKLVLKHAASMVVVGVGIGVVLSLAGNRALTTGSMTQGFQLIAPDFVWFTTATIALLLTTFAAATIPAWRASRVDPVQALRQE
jgi:macrolide transport system ATP-binding/permease protein